MKTNSTNFNRALALKILFPILLILATAILLVSRFQAAQVRADQQAALLKSQKFEKESRWRRHLAYQKWTSGFGI
jgi:hypothetical protein